MPSKKIKTCCSTKKVHDLQVLNVTKLERGVLVRSSSHWLKISFVDKHGLQVRLHQSNVFIGTVDIKYR